MGTTPARRAIAVIDGNSLMHRAFHAISASMTSPSGEPTNAVFGFLSMLVKLIDTFHPWGVICCFDKGKPTGRMELLPAYKANRPPMDPALRVQFPMAHDLLAAMDVPICELEGWEGDDLLGTLARRGSAEGYEMLLVTGDRDMYQLSSPTVKVLSTKRGMSDVSVMTPEAVADLYGGITPALVPDFYGLKGDSSDNIPGVPGVGPKKAAALIEQFGSLDAVLAHADEIPGKMGQNVREHREDALVSRQVALIRTDAPLEVDLAESELASLDADAVRRAFGALGFGAITTRLLRAVGAEGDGSAAAPPASTALEPPVALKGTAARDALDEAIRQGRWLAMAMASHDGGTLFGLERRLFVATDGSLLVFEDDGAIEVLTRAFEDGRVVALDTKDLMQQAYPADTSQPAALSIERVTGDRLFDCGVAAYLLDSQNSEYSLEYLARTYLATELPSGDDAPDGGALEAWAALKLHPVLARRIEECGARVCFEEIEMPLVPVLAAMERRGMYADPEVLRDEATEIAGTIEALRARIFDEAGETFSLDSPKQLSHVLFDVLGLPTKGLRKTHRGYYSTNARTLGELAKGHEIVREVLEYRERDKIRSTYLVALPQLIRGDGRIHTSLNQTVAATGRLSSSNPNLQNIPVRSALGRQVRRAFTVAEGHVFLACDYSQIELRLLAHLSGDEGLIQAFTSGLDFHAATASRVFGIAADEVSPALRSRAKAVNFGIVYGQQAFGLSQSLGISREEAQGLIDSYYAAYPGVRRYLDETVEAARRLGYAETMYGRRRPVPEIGARNPQRRAFAERTAMNHPMQGSAADIIKIAMARVESEIRREGLASQLILQIHDELDLEVPEAELQRVAALVKETMEAVVELRVPLVAETSWGATWADAK